ncbi:MAG: hypothetical protein Q9192_006477 [Flavoplaca navasiana]
MTRPILRITPNELHIRDIDFYDQLYRRENKLDKYPGQTKGFGVPGVLVASDSRQVHRHRRLPLAPYFSKKSVAEMSVDIEERLKVLYNRMSDSSTTGNPMPLGLAFVALTTDIISKYALADCYHLLERDDLGVDYHQLLNMEKDVDALNKHSKYNPNGPEPGIFAGRLRSNLPPSEKAAERMSSEGLGLLVAGSETTAQTLSVTTYHILANPGIVTELRKQFQIAMPEAGTLPSLANLEAIPYLYACVQEGLRLSYGISGRLMRVAHHPIEFQDWKIPPGVAVGMSTVFMHDDETVFPDHKSFKPERWLETREDGVRLEKYLTAFGKGDRHCIGMK